MTKDTPPTSDANIIAKNGALIQEIAASYRKQYGTGAPQSEHLIHLLASATLRQEILEQRSLELLETVSLDDPILARVERFRAAAERSYYKALKELKELLQNKPNPEIEVSETKPMTLSFEELRASFPRMDRNAIARMAAGLPPR